MTFTDKDAALSVLVEPATVTSFAYKEQHVSVKSYYDLDLLILIVQFRLRLNSGLLFWVTVKSGQTSGVYLIS